MSTPTRASSERPSLSTAPSMLAVTQNAYGSAEVLTCERIPLPAPGPREVLVQVEAAALDRGTWHLMTGLPRIVRLVMGVRRPRQRVIGRDVAGRVVATGSDVTTLRTGQQVFGSANGSFAEFATARADKVALAPSRVPAELSAALAISGLTALQALDAARVEHGQRVLVIGASGGVGSYAVKLAVARGAVVTAACSAAKAEEVRSWGASQVLDYEQQDVAAGSRVYDVILDIAGGTPLRRLRRALTATGSIVFVGNEGSGVWTGGYGRPMRNLLRMAFARQRYVMLTSREAAPGDLSRLAALVDAGTLQPHVHAAYAMTDVREAMTELASGRVCGKVVLVIQPGQATDSGAEALGR